MATRAHPLPHLLPPSYEVRLTIPAREALERAGNAIDRPPSVAGLPVVTVRSPPPGLIVVIADVLGEQSTAVRTAEEPAWPREFEAGWALRGQWVPCPTCGAALLWCEAGFVPGWRICLSGHAVQLAADGRSGKRHAKQDAATLRATKPL